MVNDKTIIEIMYEQFSVNAKKKIRKRRKQSFYRKKN